MRSVWPILLRAPTFTNLSMSMEKTAKYCCDPLREELPTPYLHRHENRKKSQTFLIVFEYMFGILGDCKKDCIVALVSYTPCTFIVSGTSNSSYLCIKKNRFLVKYFNVYLSVIWRCWWYELGNKKTKNKCHILRNAQTRREIFFLINGAMITLGDDW